MKTFKKSTKLKYKTKAQHQATKSKKPFILLTGDDSVRAEGIVLVKRIVEQFADFAIVATKKQQSAVGGKTTFTKPISWGREIVDGHEAYWVDGSPTDAVYFGMAVVKRKPDLVISGVNLGENIASSIHKSGTLAATILSSQEFLTKSIAFSIITHTDWFREHDGTISSDLLNYPGKMIEKITKLALKTTFEPYTFWNINFPEEETDQFAVVTTSQKPYWKNNPVIADDYTFTYGDEKLADDDVNTDVSNLYAGKITIAPCIQDFTDHHNFAHIKKICEKGLNS